MNQPTVSVVIPTYNVEKYLRECLDSVCRQTLTNIEVICVDDGSTDATPRILAEYAVRDPRISIFPQPRHTSVGTVRNIGLDAAHGTYLYFMDADDLIPEKTMLEEAVGACESDSLDQLVFSAMSFCEDEKFFSENRNARKLSRKYRLVPDVCGKVASGSEMLESLYLNKCYSPCLWLRLLRTATVRSAGLRFLDGICHEDDFFTPLSLIVSQRVRALDRTLYRRRIRPDSVMTTLGNEKQRFDSSLRSFLALSCGGGNPAPNLADPAYRLSVQHLFTNVANRYAHLADQDRRAILRKSAASASTNAIIATFEVRLADRLRNRELKRLCKGLKSKIGTLESARAESSAKLAALHKELANVQKKLADVRAQRNARPNSIRRCLAFIVRRIVERITGHTRT